MKPPARMFLFAAFACALTLAQTAAQPLAFEVASVKIHEGPVPFPRTMNESDRSVQYRPTALFSLVLKAYGINYYQAIVPEWIRTARYDIEATLPARATRADIPAMLQQLLKDRFDLKIREEIREVPVYALVVGKDGHRMRTCIQCPESKSITRSDAWIKVQANSVPDLIGRLQTGVDRPLVDRTGLSGNFDILVEAAQIGSDTGQQEGLPSLFTEIQKLGLRLESTKAPIKFLVVDGGNSTPSEN